MGINHVSQGPKKKSKLPHSLVTASKGILLLTSITVAGLVANAIYKNVRDSRMYKDNDKAMGKEFQRLDGLMKSESMREMLGEGRQPMINQCYNEKEACELKTSSDNFECAQDQLQCLKEIQ